LTAALVVIGAAQASTINPARWGSKGGANQEVGASHQRLAGEPTIGFGVELSSARNLMFGRPETARLALVTPGNLRSTTPLTFGSASIGQFGAGPAPAGVDWHLLRSASRARLWLEHAECKSVLGLMAEHTYRDFTIETFELGRDQWHARVRRRDSEAFVLDGIHLRDLDVGFSWPTSDIAFQDACRFIDRMARSGA